MIKFVSKLAAVAVISSLSASMAFASTVHWMKATVNCPDISIHTKDKLTNYGTYIAGLGTERINSDAPTYPLFEGPVLPGANIPINLVTAGYDGSGVVYNPSTGAVVCNYASSMGFDSFSVSYLLKNAKGGYTVSSGDEEIKFKFPVGLK